MQRMLKNNMGITLIALSITIIVLLILAGISIASLSGDNGILNNAKGAKEQVEIDSEKELIGVATAEAAGKNISGNITSDELQEELKGEATVEKYRKKLIVTMNKSQRMYSVDEKGNVSEFEYVAIGVMEDGRQFNNRMKEYKENILTITVVDNLNVPENVYKVFDISKEQKGNVKAWMIQNDTNANMYDLYIGAKEGVDITNCNNMFAGFKNCSKIDLEHLYTENVNAFNHMFYQCENLTSINLNNINTAKATNMMAMFWDCKKLESIDLSNFDTSNVTSMETMFTYCYNLTNIDLSNFDTTNVTSMQSMFLACKKITDLDLTNFNTSNVEDMGDMFTYCDYLTNLDLSSFNTDKVTDMNVICSMVVIA